MKALDSVSTVLTVCSRKQEIKSKTVGCLWRRSHKASSRRMTAEPSRDSQQDIRMLCLPFAKVRVSLRSLWAAVTHTSPHPAHMPRQTLPFHVWSRSRLHSLRMPLLLWPQVTFYWVWMGLSSQRSAGQRPLAYWRARPPQWYSKSWKSRIRSPRKTAAQKPWTPTTTWPHLVTGPHPGSCGWNYHSESQM